MSGTRNAVPTVSTGDWITAGWINTYIGDNEAAHWPYTTAGDLAYGVSSAELTRLGIGGAGALLKSSGSAPAWLAAGAAYKLLRMNSAGNSPEWAQSPIVVATKFNATGHSYNGTTERDMPNSSGTITPLVTSTVIMVARLNMYTNPGNCIARFYAQISGTNGNVAQHSYGGGEGHTISFFAVKTGVTAGAKTLVIREKEGYGAGVAYNVDLLEWFAIAIPQ